MLSGSDDIDRVPRGVGALEASVPADEAEDEEIVLDRLIVKALG